MTRVSPILAIIIGILTATIPTFLLFQAVTYLFVVPLGLGLFCIFLGLIGLRTRGKLSQHVVWIAIIIMLGGVFIPFGMIAYYNRSAYPIVVIVPEGYRGPIKLIVDKNRGIDVPLKEGRFIYHIPPSGTLLIKDDGPFHQWHSMTAKYTNGMAIPMRDENTLAPGEVAYFGLGSGMKVDSQGTREEYIQDFVGTKGELRKYVDRH
jgi:hypothetical protein